MCWTGATGAPGLDGSNGDTGVFCSPSLLDAHVMYMLEQWHWNMQSSAALQAESPMRACSSAFTTPFVAS